MRILAVTTSFPHAADPASGRFVRDLHEGLVAEGHSVFTAHPSHARHATPYDTRCGSVWPVALPTDDARTLVGPGGMEANARAMGMFRARAALRAVEEAVVSLARDRLRDADMVLAHWTYPTGAWMAPLCRRAGKPLVGVAHGGDVRLLGRPFLGLLPRLRLRGALTGLVATSRAGADAMVRSLGLSADAVLVTPMGYDPSVFAAQRGAGAPGASSGPVVAAGRLIPIKGFDVLIRALEGLGRPLRLAGDGPERAALERLARASGVDVAFLGALSPDALADEFRRAAVVVVPSRIVAGGSEGVPLVALEAAACGTRVIGSAVGGLPDVLPARALVPPDDVPALAAALKACLAGEGTVPTFDPAPYAAPVVARRISEFLKLRTASFGR